MWPFEASSNERGSTLIELMIASGLSVLVIAGGVQLYTQSERYAKVDGTKFAAETGVIGLESTVTKLWNLRLRNTIPTISVPSTGYILKKSSTGVACTSKCTYLQLYIARTVNIGTSAATKNVIDNVTIETLCTAVTDPTSASFVSSLQIHNRMDLACSTCPAGQVPIVRMTSVLRDSNNVVLQTEKLPAENKILPQNLKVPGNVSKTDSLGYQLCFSKVSVPANSPLTMTTRAYVADPATLVVSQSMRTSLAPDENFAKIRLTH